MYDVTLNGKITDNSSQFSQFNLPFIKFKQLFHAILPEASEITGLLPLISGLNNHDADL